MIITSGKNEIEIIKQDAGNPCSALSITLTAEDSLAQFKGCHDAVLFEDSDKAKNDLDKMLSMNTLNCLIELTEGSSIKIQTDTRGRLNINCSIRRHKTLTELAVEVEVDGEYREQTIRELMDLL